MTMKLTVLALAVLGILYSIVLEIVRYRSASNPTPPVVADVYDAETYQTWKHYSAAHGRRNLVTAFAAGVITVLLLSTDAYAAFASLFPVGVY